MVMVAIVLILSRRETFDLVLVGLEAVRWTRIPLPYLLIRFPFPPDPPLLFVVVDWAAFEN